MLSVCEMLFVCTKMFQVFDKMLSVFRKMFGATKMLPGFTNGGNALEMMSVFQKYVFGHL